MEYIPAKNILEKVHQETFGKSGCRRIVPGQYLAIDPKGRAVMVGAIEKQKLVYILNRDNEARLTISSPLEAHKSSTLTYHMVGVDVGFENPMFACLEIDYEKADSDPTGKQSKLFPFLWVFTMCPFFGQHIHLFRCCNKFRNFIQTCAKGKTSNH